MMQEFITVVSGVPRSGTSLMMQMLHAGGMPALTDQIRAEDTSNPRGYFEYEPVKHLRTDRAWLPLARGRAVKIIHLLLRELPMDGTEQYRVVFMQRPWEEVLASQRVMLERLGRATADPEKLRRVFEEQTQQICSWLAVQPCVKLQKVEYHRAVSDPAAIATDLSAFLGMKLDLPACIAAVEPALHRQRTGAINR
jgi:hypothetical protein